MRWSWMAWGLVLAACGGEPPPEHAEDILVLELGGGNEPLNRALLRLRQVGEPPPETLPDAEPPPVEEPIEVPTENRVEAARPAAPPAPEFFSVYLCQGETLYGLARTHLGDASRWRELLAPNGWTEAQAVQLPVGTMVKLPIR